MKKIYLLPLFIWIAISAVEVFSYFFLYPRPMYFRAWEYVLNEGTDSYYVPFQPHLQYQGTMTGDLLVLNNFRPKKNEIRKQFFQVDEYGFRNRVGLLDNPVEVVLTGTSFVGGAEETQENLISELLTDKYRIPSYNYATLPLQHFWEDTRFVKRPPKFVVIIGNEMEILQQSWIEVLVPSTTTHEVPKWSSHEEWAKKHNQFVFSYESIAKELKRYSYVRYLSKNVNRFLLNEIYSRESLAQNDVRKGLYDPVRDIYFADLETYNPLLTDESKKRIQKTVDTLLLSKKTLATRNIQLIVAVVPSKSSLHANRYKDVVFENKTLSLLHEEFNKNSIDFVNIAEPLFRYVSKTGNLVYYPDDGHWNTKVNELLSELLARKINELKKEKL